MMMFRQLESLCCTSGCTAVAQAICHNTIEPIAREARFARVANTLRLDRGDQTQEKKIFRQLKVLIFAKAKC